MSHLLASSDCHLLQFPIAISGICTNGQTYGERNICKSVPQLLHTTPRGQILTTKLIFQELWKVWALLICKTSHMQNSIYFAEKGSQVGAQLKLVRPQVLHKCSWNTKKRRPSAAIMHWVIYLPSYSAEGRMLYPSWSLKQECPSQCKGIISTGLILGTYNALWSGS